jgi:uncharacterized membrane protein YbaN (DUF454 family)
MTSERGQIAGTEWRWTLLLGLTVLAATSLPYLVAWSRETPERAFSGCILLVEDCYSYLAKMRQGADGAWLFHISYTPERHPGTLFYLFHLILGKIARLLPCSDVTNSLVLVYHAARLVFGMGFLLTLYRFLAALTQRVIVRRLAWLMVALGGGMGWLLAALGQARWLGNVPLDLYFAEGFAFIALFGFPHVAAAQSLLLASFLCLLRTWSAGTSTVPAPPAADPQNPSIGDARPSTIHRLSRLTPVTWAALTGLLWLLMGLIVPFYVAVAWAVTGAAWAALSLRRGPPIAIRWREARLAGVAASISAPVIIYSLWVFTSDPVYGTWAAQNRILSPHPLLYLAAYGMPLLLAIFAVKETWHDEGWAWATLPWIAVVPGLVYLPVNLQLRLATGVQMPLSLLAARSALRFWRRGRRWLVIALLLPMIPTSAFVISSSSAWMISRPSPSFRDTSEIAAMDWLSDHARPGETVLSAYETGAYLPARVNARVLVGHDLEATNAKQKRELVNHFFDAATDDAWRRRFLADYGIDYVFWGPAERRLGPFDPTRASYLQEAHAVAEYVTFTVEL